jgi:hypothetical protein
MTLIGLSGTLRLVYPELGGGMLVKFGAPNSSLMAMFAFFVSSTNRTGYLPSESRIVKVAENNFPIVRPSNFFFSSAVQSGEASTPSSLQ